jgi:prepilin-type N-terminal cleavage/methylation domain-containing protein
MSRNLRPEPRGFTLVENLVALAILAGSLVALGGVLVEVRRQIAIARMETLALAVARGISEDLGATGFEGLWRELGLDGSVAWARVDARSAPSLSAWPPILGRSLGRARAEIDLTTLAPSPGTPLADAHAIRLLVIVTWAEPGRERSVRLATVRL